MVAENFNSSLKRVLVHEGGYSRAAPRCGALPISTMTPSDGSGVSRSRTSGI
jgi:hypothetical protein